MIWLILAMKAQMAWSFKGSPHLITELSQIQPRWTDDYSVAQIHYRSDNWILGALGGWGEFATSERSSYSAGYSLSLAEAVRWNVEWLHQDWFYISTGRDIFSSKFELYHKGEVGPYWTVGLYRRYQKQRWDDNPHAPLNLETEDIENFLLFLWAWQFAVNGDDNLEFTWSNFDAMNVFGPDHWQAQLNYRMPLGGGPSLGLSVGVLISGLSGLTGYFNQYHAGVSLVY